ncbi:hypothetical protein AB4189_24120, partial [Vibrio sp. 10N.286.49.E1]|uniref:hypothetical protein n=1 Tax=Vibrio sp. 10N.286.49.E1 TaxID=3229702 RepID=UPI00354CD46A
YYPIGGASVKKFSLCTEIVTSGRKELMHLLNMFLSGRAVLICSLKMGLNSRIDLEAQRIIP